MGEEHGRFEAMALSHVLGGLADGDATAFRGHLRDCPACRARVAELRALSSDLDAAERDERRRRAAARRREGAPAGSPQAMEEPRTHRRAGRLAIGALALASLPLAFWNLHLREASDAYFLVAEERATTIEALATGTIVEVVGPAGERGRIALDAARIAVVLVDVGPLGSDERLVAWRGPGDVGEGTAWEREVLAVGPEPDVGVSRVIVRDGAERFVVTRERGLLGAAPSGTVIAEVVMPMDPSGP